MYSRDVGGKTYTFEVSGGLLNAGLVLQDRETDSYWSIITETALKGPAEGAELDTLPGAVKTTWGEWRREHPRTRVLSVDGVEHATGEKYQKYFASEKGFRDMEATDRRLPDKESIYAFFDGETASAVAHRSFLGGGAFELRDGRQLFLYRLDDDSHYRSTSAFTAPPRGRFVRAGDRWQLELGDRVVAWNPQSRAFEGEIELQDPGGFDTFWYIWSLTHENSSILGPPSVD